MTATLGTDYLMPELTALLATATQESDLHTNQHGLCADCGSAWPCERAQGDYDF